MVTEALDRNHLAAARLWAAHRFPYLATAVFASPVVEAPGIGTVSVDDQWRLYVDPEIANRWSVAELGSTLVHHTSHLLRDHCDRAHALGIDRDQTTDWVRAADAEINDDFAAGGLDLPGDPVFPSTLGCEPGRLAEEYYQSARVTSDAHDDTGDGDPHACGSGADGVHRDYEVGGDDRGRRGIDGHNQELLRAQAAQDTLRHQQEAGDVPLGLRRWAENLLRPKVDWRRALAAELRRGIADVSGSVDYSYRRPSRRATVSEDVVLPSLRRPVPEVAVVCDTSGSMTETQLTTVLTELEGLLSAVGVRRQSVRVLSCDVTAHAVQRVSSAREVRLYGGGGTDMGAGILAALATRPKPAVIVVLTDGYTPWPPTAPKGTRVIVGLLGDHPPQAPAWARAVRIDAVQSP
jgi:predicted metal-dependent peptidase